MSKKSPRNKSRFRSPEEMQSPDRLFAEISKGVNKKHHIVELAHAGDIAEQLFDLLEDNVKKREWGKRVIY